MTENIGLALLGIIFGWLFFYSKRTVLAYIFFFLWILFIPNTIYLITDLQHISKQWVGINYFERFLIVSQYLVLAVLGVVSYIVAMHPIEKVFNELKLKRRRNVRFIVIVLVNLFIAFGLILGKFQRTHSWYIFTDFNRVISDVTAVLKAQELLGVVLLFGVVINLVYFGFKNMIDKSLARDSIYKS